MEPWGGLRGSVEPWGEPAKMTNISPSCTKMGTRGFSRVLITNLMSALPSDPSMTPVWGVWGTTQNNKYKPQWHKNGHTGVFEGPDHESEVRFAIWPLYDPGLRGQGEPPKTTSISPSGTKMGTRGFSRVLITNLMSALPSDPSMTPVWGVWGNHPKQQV